MLKSKFKIGEKLIGVGAKPYCIAEVGSNFDQSLDKAKKLIDVAAEAGADAVKFQLFSADKLYPDGGSMYDIFKSIELNPDWIPKLYRHALDNGLDFLASTFDLNSIDVLESVNVSAYKVASSEITNWPMLYKLAKTGKPLIISTGMSDMVDIEEAVNICVGTGNNQICLLQCGALYPLSNDLVNLRVITTLSQRFNCPVGFSDHTLGQIAAIAAVGVGSVMFEKHITLDKTSSGPDHFYAQEPHELKTYIFAIGEAYKALGSGDKSPLQREQEIGRRDGIYLTRNMSKGETISFEDIQVKRPAIGLRSRYITLAVGATLNQSVEKDQPLTWNLLSF